MISHRRAGFTLLEICLALAIGVMIIVLAVPSIAGLLAEQRLEKSFERLDRLAALARQRSVTEQRAYVLAWDREGITAAPAERVESDAADAAVERLVFAEKETYELRRPAALLKKAPSTWLFWRNGTCEPAQIAFRGAAGSWLVNYDPLTARGTFLQSEVP